MGRRIPSLTGTQSEVDFTVAILGADGAIPPSGSSTSPMYFNPAQNTYQLASNNTLTSGGGVTAAVTGIIGGGYILTVQGTFAAGSSVQLQTLGPDGTTYISVGTAITATNSSQTFAIGNNATVRLINSGSANVTALYASLN